jgi:hypothetical protein
MPPATGAKVSRAGIEAIKRQRELMNVIENIDDELAEEMALAISIHIASF